jgi:hypothetical protein
MENQFATRPDPNGFSVVDRTTGEVVAIASIRQTGLTQADADHTVSLLNARAKAETTH